MAWNDRNFAWRIVLTVIGLFSVSCTGGRPSGTLSIQLPPIESLSRKPAAYGAATPVTVATVQRVMVTVTANGVPQLAVWERNNQNSAAPQLAFDFNVPATTGSILVQALIVVQTDGMNFFYAESSPSASQSSVDLNLEQIGTPSAGTGGIAGRLLSSSSAGPTGIINIYLALPGRNPMLVTRSEAFAGWFDVFATQDPATPMKYAFADGTPLLPGGALDSFSVLKNGLFDLPSAAVNSTRTMRVFFPAYWRDRGDGTREYAEQKRYIVGFFGPGSSSKSACFDPSVSVIPSSYMTTAGTMPLTWAGPNPVTSGTFLAAGVETVSSGTTIVAKGNSSCSPSQYDFVNGIKFSQNDANGGNVGHLGFYGPFKTAATGEPVVATASSGTVNLSWSTLPGVDAAGVIDGFDVFGRTGLATSYGDELKNDDGYDCPNAGSYGFAKILSVPTSVGTSTYAASVSFSQANSALLPATSFTPTTFSAAYSAGLVHFLVCPKKSSIDGGYFRSAAFVRNGRGAQGVLAPDAIQLRDFAGNVFSSSLTVAPQSCVPIYLTATSASMQTSVPMGAAANWAANGSLFGEPTCTSTPYSSTFSLNGGSQSALYYMPPSSGSFDSLTISSGTSGGFASSVAASGSFSLVSAGSATQMKVYMPSTIGAFQCVPMTLMAFSALGAPAAPSMTQIISPLSGWQIFSPNDWTCAGTNLSSLTTNPSYSYQTSWQFNAMYTGVATSGTFATSNAATGGNIGVPFAPNLTITQPGAATKFTVAVEGTMAVGSCRPIVISLADSSGRSAVNPLAASLSFNVGGSALSSGVLYSDSSCSNSPTPQIGYQRSASAPLYFQPTTAGQSGLTFTVSGGGLSGISNAFNVP